MPDATKLFEKFIRDFGVLPLTDEDPMPFGGDYKGTKLVDVPADYLMWCYGQDWVRERYPRLFAYLKKEHKALMMEIVENE